MNSISGVGENLLTIFNQPIVKEGVKNITSSVTFVFGLVEFYDIYQIARGREIKIEAHSDYPKWCQLANKVIIVCAKISLIMSAGISRPGVFIISSLIGSVFSTSQLNRLFGPYTIFSTNPWHPRHVVSIAAIILTFPSLAQSTYNGFILAYKKIQQHQDTSTDIPKIRFWLTDTQVKLMTLFNTATSRPVLHLGNQLGRFIMHPAGSIG